MFVKTRLRFARGIRVGGPEAGAVGREGFVDEKQLIAIEAEFEFRVGDNNAALGGVIAGEAVQRQRNVADSFSERLADDFGATAEVDVLIVARLGFGRGRENGVGELA